VSRQISAVLSTESPSPAVVLELLKPITWFPPMWAFACGLVSSGAAFRGRWSMVVTGTLLCGPLLCATSQAVNDWFDRHVDAINEPERPIPSGRMPGRWGLYIAVLWTVLSLLCAATLGTWVLGASAVGLALAWAYSAPPIRLKRNGWWGNLACAVCYEGFAWVTGAAVLTGGMPSPRIFILAALYSLGAHGIMTLNDFKSVAGDERMGVASLPVQLGVPGAARVACLAMLLPQIVVVMCLMSWGRLNHAAAIVVLIGAQLLCMQRFLSDPRQQALWYSGAGVPIFVSGMMVSAFALRGLAV
jgi:chlorophyll synthase